MTDKYILKNKMPVPCEDLAKWGAWCEERGNRRVAQDVNGGVRVSTVFLGIDYRMDDEGPPILFETMVFGGEHDGKQDRYSTWREAELGHKVMCNEVFTNDD